MLRRTLTLSDLKKSKGLHYDKEGTAIVIEGLKNADKLQNPLGLMPLTLPLRLCSLLKVPVIVSAGSDAPGKPLHLITILYVTVDNKAGQTSIHQRSRRSTRASTEPHSSGTNSTAEKSQASNLVSSQEATNRILQNPKERTEHGQETVAESTAVDATAESEQRPVQTLETPLDTTPL